jgi:hypothetical protein
MTPSGIDPATFLFVVQCLNHCITAYPQTKGPTLVELFTATGKLNFFLTTSKFDVCTTGDTAHMDTIFKFLPHTRQHGCIDILYCCNDPCLKARIMN